MPKDHSSTTVTLRPSWRGVWRLMAGIDIAALGVRSAQTTAAEQVQLCAMELYDDAVVQSRRLLAEHAVAVLAVREKLSLDVTGAALRQDTQLHQTLPELRALVDYFTARAASTQGAPDADATGRHSSTSSALSASKQLFSEVAPLAQAQESLARLEREQEAFEAEQRAMAGGDNGPFSGARSRCSSRVSSVQSLVSDDDDED